MTRNPLILVTLALGLVLGGCSNRSIGNKIDDQFLEPNVANAISRSHPDLTGPTSHIVVTAYNGVILLAGQTPRADLKEKAAQVANGVQGVKKLHNELQVLQPTSALARSNDALITSKIKTLMLADSKVPSAKVKVVTENGIVYLMGLVTRAEGAAATNVASGASGVQKIVTLYQYTN
ncbi:MULTISPECIES: BON domain-containing protein [Pseudomonadaceae]|jgi:osmotically-inducible protein OsmY|uniref:BON domain-containing protein n=2 Tax=Aquipseudomonas alcaligenes TaxID=43263 RepID=A0A142INN0_AQUAC|nr:MULTISPECIES: BON domain-containing protein [Pseudomonas]AMR65912.1 phospholipid-binding protein [Pseudomonas alcaligenes]MDH0144480.1 BON domain-containing protein [Pseudomonas alcaligenes]NMY41616.1 BON domain-containing protein [Pseudomonas sp. WS 5013]TXI32567.1 MAG: BON domain-containing protein [Pseudomonas alcaligenes]SIS23533.1 Osmotically-inducible protein OsmY, contains BON domain [Pseudomonas alcaligenes]